MHNSCHKNVLLSYLWCFQCSTTFKKLALALWPWAQVKLKLHFGTALRRDIRYPPHSARQSPFFFFTMHPSPIFCVPSSFLCLFFVSSGGEGLNAGVNGNAFLLRRPCLGPVYTVHRLRSSSKALRISTEVTRYGPPSWRHLLAGPEFNGVYLPRERVWDGWEQGG